MMRSLTRVIAITVAAVIATATFTAEAPPASAWVAAKLWDPGFIISDQQFFDEDAMSVAQIQSFLNAKVPTCHPERSTGPSDPIVCLKDFKQTTTSRAADSYCPNAYVGASNETAATIIYKVAQACGISPKVILVTLQKEVGLVTHSWPSEWRYERAMGYGCPDTAPCNVEYYGFQNQVWRAARQFQVYAARPTYYGHRAGIVNNVRFHPNTACGTSSVLIKNQATAGLYNYTPYQPNSAALAAMPGTGNSCSSYGNRNFWMYYWEWFGNPHATGALTNVTTSDRIAGANRYATAAALSASFPAEVDVVYVASGQNYPDALAVAPIAASQDAPLLLVRHDAVTPETAAALTRLKPKRIVVVGGPGAVNQTTYTALAGYAEPDGISRLGGVDRYETARLAIRAHWTAGSASLVYVASGRDYPDALSAAAAAGAQDAPVISVDGTAKRLDAETAALIAELGATKIVIAGGNGAVSSGIQTDLAAIPGVTEVRRVGGSDRYATSAAINADAFATASGVYLASGGDFPDALAGAAFAGRAGAPLYIVRGTCIPGSVADGVQLFGPVKATLLGGTGVLPMTLSTVPRCS
jgi:putative cell wall-binding protein